jgi:hypothetical protein
VILILKVLIYHARVGDAFVLLALIGFGQHNRADVFRVQLVGQFILIDATIIRPQQTLGVAHNLSVNPPVDI